MSTRSRPKNNFKKSNAPVHDPEVWKAWAENELKLLEDDVKRMREAVESVTNACAAVNDGTVDIEDNTAYVAYLRTQTLKRGEFNFAHRAGMMERILNSSYNVVNAVSVANLMRRNAKRGEVAVDRLAVVADGLFHIESIHRLKKGLSTALRLDASFLADHTATWEALKAFVGNKRISPEIQHGLFSVFGADSTHYSTMGNNLMTKVLSTAPIQRVPFDGFAKVFHAKPFVCSLRNISRTMSFHILDIHGGLAYSLGSDGAHYICSVDALMPMAVSKDEEDAAGV